MSIFSKSKLMACRQCPRRFWLELHRPDLKEFSTASLAAFGVGYAVGEVARKLYDPTGEGAIIDVAEDGPATAINRTRELLAIPKPIFEAGFEAEGAKAFSDVLLPVLKDDILAWRMVEVKASARVHNCQRDDVAIQTYAARNSGLPLSSVAIAHVDSSWVYPGDEAYDGLLIEEDLTEEAFGRCEEVKEWIAEAQSIAASPEEPEILTGSQCWNPFECGFLGYCAGREPQPTYPVFWLPGIRSTALRELIEERQVRDMRQVPDDLLSDRQRLVKTCTLNDTTFFDAKGAAEALAPHGLPAYFLDFETIMFAVPIWKGTRPYQQIPFQFSVHRLSESGNLEDNAFLDLTGTDPSKALAEAVIAACADCGPVYVYSASFESGRLDELAQRFPDLERPLRAIVHRLVDLIPVAKHCYYHPAQQGSWSLKAVLPTVAPDLDYAKLDGVQDGGTAMQAYLEAIHPVTSIERRAVIRNQLLDYCRHDTYALVRLWQHFAGRADLTL